MAYVCSCANPACLAYGCQLVSGPNWPYHSNNTLETTVKELELAGITVGRPREVEDAMKILLDKGWTVEEALKILRVGEGDG